MNLTTYHGWQEYSDLSELTYFILRCQSTFFKFLFRSYLDDKLNDVSSIVNQSQKFIVNTVLKRCIKYADRTAINY